MEQPAADPAAPGIIGRIYNAAIGQQAAPVVQADVERENLLLAQANAIRDRLRAEAEIQQLQAEAASRRLQHEETAYYALREAMIGKRLDATWRAYAANVVRDYLDRSHVSDHRIRVEVMDSAIQRYIQYLHTEPKLQLTDILSINDHNRDLKCQFDRTVWWNPLTWHLKTELQGNDNGSSPAHQLYSLPQIMAVGSLGVIGILGMTYATSKVWSSLTTSITTPKMTAPPTPPIKIDIDLTPLNNTIETALANSTTILKSLSDIQDRGLERNTSMVLMTELSARFISAISNAFNKTVELAREYSHSPK